MTQSSHEIQIARRIKSRAQIAQLVEQRTENPRVAGSIPALGIFFIRRKPRRIKGFRRFFMVEKSPRWADSVQKL